MPIETSDALFEMDDDGWIAQNKGRELWELFRELLQNSMDSGGDIKVRVDSRQKKIEVIDDGDGIDRIEDVWRIFGGDKGKDPTKRGRFGRGLKEFVASCQYVKVETTSGVVEFDVENRQRTIDTEAGRERGTRVVAQNRVDWKQRDVKQIWEYVRKIWVPEGMQITVDLKGGRTNQNERWEPDFTFDAYLKTVVFDEESGKMDTTYRNTDVHVKRAEGTDGRLYEMGIPVDLEAPFPYYVDVQQKIPLAEQRNEPDSFWYERKLQPALVDALFEAGEFENLSDKQLREDWLTKALQRCDNQEAKEYWVDRILRDGRKKGLVVKSDDSTVDIAEQQGYQVFDTARAGSSVGSIAKDVAKTSADIADEVADRSKSQVNPSPAQRDFMNQAEELAEMAGYPDLTFQTWRWESPPNARHSAAEHMVGGIVRLNVNERDFEEMNAENAATVIHEIAHEQGRGHDREWYKEMERIAGVLLERFIE